MRNNPDIARNMPPQSGLGGQISPTVQGFCRAPILVSRMIIMNRPRHPWPWLTDDQMSGLPW